MPNKNAQMGLHPPGRGLDKRKSLQSISMSGGSGSLWPSGPATTNAPPKTMPITADSVDQAPTRTRMNIEVSKAVVDVLRCVPANNAFGITSYDIFAVLLDNPPFVPFCEKLENMGLKFDRAHLARHVMARVPGLANSSYGKSSVASLSALPMVTPATATSAPIDGTTALLNTADKHPAGLGPLYATRPNEVSIRGLKLREMESKLPGLGGKAPTTDYTSLPLKELQKMQARTLLANPSNQMSASKKKNHDSSHFASDFFDCHRQTSIRETLERAFGTSLGRYINIDSDLNTTDRDAIEQIERGAVEANAVQEDVTEGHAIDTEGPPTPSVAPVDIPFAPSGIRKQSKRHVRRRRTEK